MSTPNFPDREDLEFLPLGRRLRRYWRLTGPGYMQSAMTLGAGTIASCAVLGSLLGYELLWVQPVGMLLGFFLLAAVAKQTCQTGERPYRAFWERLHPLLAVLWGASAFVATILWHVPQYSLTADGIVTLAAGIGIDLGSTGARLGIGAGVLLLAVWVVQLYGAGARGLQIYERAVKALVWLIVVSFLVVVLGTGVRWGPLVRGLTGVTFLRDLLDGDGLDRRAISPIVGGIAATVGINMVFLYPYSVLRKGWGRRHEELAYFDLATGMVLPFVLATGFMVLAVANTIGPAEGQTAGQSVQDIRQVVPVLKPTFGALVGEALGGGLALLIVGLGMTAIGFSTIITHMLASGFIGGEMAGLPADSRGRRWFAMAPATGVVGVVAAAPLTVAITASTLAAPLMPVTVVCFLVLMNRRSYLGEATPRGIRRLVWNGGLGLAAAALTVNACFALRANWEKLHGEPGPAPAPAAPPAASPEPGK
ncbi:MAG: divalent metal cation transporter [Planctomycetota bacterium]